MAEQERTISIKRLEALSDGVFAIAITLLVLEISVPSGSRDLLRDVASQWPSYLAYAVSFATIGGVWLAHNVITEYLSHADPPFIRLNLILLMVVAFLPFPTRLIAEYIHEENQERIAATLYGLTLFGSTLLVSLLWNYALRRGLLEPSAAAEIRLLTRRLTPSLGGYIMLLVLGLFFPVLAVFGYLVVALNLLVPIRRRRSQPRKDLSGNTLP
ncbi:MAG TPA: DUF1211 domain-containing protein [Micromonosporaceae bacterium]|nr:DUF1211 domain-containing protein [Micromonosporaceae bacterium]HCU49181.1 DUF1211 domain-containing protein [Micromonosporaceae bacterium]